MDAVVSDVQSQSTPPTLLQLEEEIKTYLGKTAQNMIEVGKRLTQAKSLVQHGEWRNWLENNFTLDERTAQRFMQIAERFSLKIVDVDAFKPSQLTEMLVLPDAEETKKFIEQKATEGTPVPDMSIKTLRKELKKWTSKKSDDTKEKNVEEQIETQKQPTHDENNSSQTDTQPEEQDKQLLDKKTVELFNTLFHVSNELVTIPDLKQKIFDFASVDPEGFYSNIDNLFQVVDIIREVDNRKARS